MRICSTDGVSAKIRRPLRRTHLCEGLYSYDERTVIAELHQLSAEAGRWNDSKKLAIISQLKKWANTTVDELRMNATFDVYDPSGKIVAECIRPMNAKPVKCS